MKKKSQKKTGAKPKKKAPPIQPGRAREDVDKKVKEEEEAKIQAEKEEAERREKEAAEADKERRKREKEELKKIRTQMPELMSTQARINVGLFTSRIVKKEQEDWERFINPSRPPNPKNLPHINAFIETTETNKANEDVTEVLKLYSLFFEFLENLDGSHEDANSRRQFIKTSMDLEGLLKKKINAATHNLLLEAKARAAHDGDFIVCESNSCVSMCIWANVSKNPRVRSIEFEERNIFIEINPFLNRLNCCIRVLFLAQDVLSQHIIATNDPLLELDFENESVHSILSYQSSTSVSSASKRSTYDPKALASAMGIDLDFAYKDKHKNFPKIFIREAKQSQAKAQPDPSEDQVDSEDATDYEDDEDFDWNKYNLVTPPREDILSEEEPSKYYDIQAYHSVGGNFQVELFALPYQPKVVKNWTIQMLVSPADVFPIPYNAENFDRSMDARVQLPLMFSFKLPDDVHFFSDPQPALFDDEHLKWSRNGFLNKVYNEATRQISFKILKFGTMTLMQDSHINMPFRSFYICPGSASNSLCMTITGRYTEVEFVLKDELVCVTKPNLPEISYFLNKLMPLSLLMKKMKHSGLNFFPGQLSFEYLSILPKKRGTVDRLYQQLSIFGNRLSMKNSVWNTVVNDEEKIVIQFNLSLQQEAQETWSLLCVSKRQAKILTMQENSDTFSEKSHSGFQSNVYSLFLNVLDRDQKELLKITTPSFVNAFYELLKATNPIAYTVMG